jgi:hypothetical protein
MPNEYGRNVIGQVVVDQVQHVDDLVGLEGSLVDFLSDIGAITIGIGRAYVNKRPKTSQLLTQFNYFFRSDNIYLNGDPFFS